MIVNVVDLREKQYRWKSILAVVESAAKNNVADDADVTEAALGVEIDYAEREDISVRDAFIWAEQVQGKVTLYLYDKDKGK
ncbi:MAG: hypothetical protein HKN27_15045 [Silicimonas sp.]|nr:hypothetical protein [Silicimonas sp.]